MNTSTIFRFADVVIERENFRLIRQGCVEKITPRAFEVLIYLIERRGLLVEKQELFDQIWKDSFVSDNALTRMVKEVRRVIGDDADAPRYIETVPKRGYRFIAELQPSAPPPIGHPAADEKAFRSIAVLPFFDLSNDPDGEYLSEGIAENIINSLSQLSGLRVVPRNTTFCYRGVEIQPEDIGRLLGVETVLTGRVLQHSEKLIIRTELIDVSKECQLWGGQYHRQPADLFALQEEVAEEISGALRLRMTGEQKRRITKRHTQNLEAYQLYLRGRYFWNKRPQGIEKAIEYFEEAIAKDPRFALAFAGLADCYANQGAWESGARHPGDAMPKAKASAMKALELDETLAEAHTSLAYVALHYDRDWATVEREYQRAIELNPNYAHAHHWYSHYQIAMGQPAEALVTSHRCLSLEPLDLVLNVHLAWHYWYTGECDAALAALQKALELDPHSLWPYYFKGLVYEQKKLLDEAVAAFQQAKGFSSATFVIAGLGHTYALAGQRAQACEQLAELNRLAEQRYVSSYDRAIIHAGLGEPEEMFAWLERGYEERSGWMVYLKAEPRLKHFHVERRFQELLQRIGLDWKHPCPLATDPGLK